MNRSDVEKIVKYLIDQGLAAIHKRTNEKTPAIDYVAIFSKDENEFQELLAVAETMGKEVDQGTARTGKTYLLDQPLTTPAGVLYLLKIRKPDDTRPQRGAPDFKIQNYAQFKEKYLRSSGSFTLMLKKDYEMIELKGVDVLVYLPDKTLGERMRKK